MTKTITTLFSLALLALASVPAQAAPDDPAAIPAGTLTSEERAELVDLLEGSRRELETLAARADGEDWSWKPAPDRWSVGEVVEHLVLAEEGIFSMAVAALDGEENPEWETIAAGASVEGLVANLKDRSQKFQAPEAFQPRSEASREELLQRFAAARASTLDYTHRTNAPLKRFTSEGPAGTMNSHQWLALLAAHNYRHNLQIREVLDQMQAARDTAEASP